jgi:DNA-binding transcriptional ArsR family regulator
MAAGAPVENVFMPNVPALSQQDLEQLTTVFRLLADRTRLNILMLLLEGERNVTSLCEELKLPQPTVSHHLGLLRMHNLITNRRSGKQVFYSLGSPGDDINSQMLQVTLDRFCVSVRSLLSEPEAAAV